MTMALSRLVNDGWDGAAAGAGRWDDSRSAMGLSTAIRVLHKVNLLGAKDVSKTSFVHLGLSHGRNTELGSRGGWVEVLKGRGRDSFSGASRSRNILDFSLFFIGTAEAGA